VDLVVDDVARELSAPATKYPAINIVATPIAINAMMLLFDFFFSSKLSFILTTSVFFLLAYFTMFFFIFFPPNFFPNSPQILIKKVVPVLSKGRKGEG
jgi:hypothetical protein